MATKPDQVLPQKEAAVFKTIVVSGAAELEPQVVVWRCGACGVNQPLLLPLLAEIL